jgi:hypothetical protein
MIDHLFKFGCLQPHLQTNDNLIPVYHPFMYCLQNDKFRQDLIQNLQTHHHLIHIDEIIHEFSHNILHFTIN